MTKITKIWRQGQARLSSKWEEIRIRNCVLMEFNKKIRGKKQTCLSSKWSGIRIIEINFESATRYTRLRKKKRKKRKKKDKRKETDMLIIEMWRDSYHHHHHYLKSAIRYLNLKKKTNFQGLEFLYRNMLVCLCPDAVTCKINGNFQRFSTAGLYQFTAGTPSERFPFVLQVAVSCALL